MPKTVCRIDVISVEREGAICDSVLVGASCTSYVCIYLTCAWSTSQLNAELLRQHIQLGQRSGQKTASGSEMKLRTLTLTLYHGTSSPSHLVSKRAIFNGSRRLLMKNHHRDQAIQRLKYSTGIQKSVDEDIHLVHWARNQSRYVHVGETQTDIDHWRRIPSTIQLFHFHSKNHNFK